MKNIYINNPKDEYDTRWFLLKGGISDAICHDNFESFRKELWHLLVLITSRVFIDGRERDEQRLTKTLDKVILMVKGSHYFLHHKKRLIFGNDRIDIKWYRNPYRSLKKYRPKDDPKLNHHLAHFEERITQLTRKESRNFTLAFENFFSEMDISSWLNLLDDWKSCVRQGDSLPEYGADCAPLTTYEKVLSLYEACILSYHWANNTYPPPNRHLIEYYLQIEQGRYQYTNPFEMLNSCFFEIKHGKLREIIKEIYQKNNTEQKDIIKNANEVRHVLRDLIQIGWLLLQTDYFPENWVKPNIFSFLQSPIPEKEMNSWHPKSLSSKERINLRKTLSKLYYNFNVLKEIHMLDACIISYLEGKVVDCNNENFKSRDRLLKILDVLTLVSFIVLPIVRTRFLQY